MNYLLGIDIGTSATKSMLIDENGVTVAEKSAEYQLCQPKNGWAEQNPEDWWEAVKVTCSCIIGESKINAANIAGVGLSGQMHGLVMLDNAGEVIRPSIIWCDQRTTKECLQINELVGKKKLMEITANPALTGFTASKILWVRNNEPENYERCKKILLPKDYIRYKLTGDFATEVSDASGMQLLDIKNRCWSEDILKDLSIDESMLGKVYESQEVTSFVTQEAFEKTGIPVGTKVVGGAGDNAASAVGTGIVRDGDAFMTIGSSGVVYSHTSRMKLDMGGRVHTFCCAVPNAWHIMGVTQAAGLSLKWYRDNFCTEEIRTAQQKGLDPYVLMNKEAEKIPIGSDKLIYLPYLMGERTPHLDPDCRGVFFGLSAIHRREHLIRAVMEGVAFSMRNCLDVFAQMDSTPKQIALCGGGAKSTLWSEIICNATNIPMYTIKQKDGGALGAAILAGVGSGMFESVEKGCDKIISKDKNFETDVKAYETYKPYYELYCSLYADLRKSFKRLGEIKC